MKNSQIIDNYNQCGIFHVFRFFCFMNDIPGGASLYIPLNEFKKRSDWLRMKVGKTMIGQSYRTVWASLGQPM